MKSATFVVCLLGSLALTGSQSTNTLEIVFGGGSPMIVKGGQTLDVATIETSIFQPDFVEHSLHLSVTLGTLDLSKTTVLPQEISHDGTVGWDLTGRAVEVSSDGNPFPAANITLPTYKALSVCDENVPAADVNNLFFLPELTRITNQSALVDEVETRFNGRVRVRGGALAVSELVAGCFEFKNQSGTVVGPPRRLAHGWRGVTYSHPFGRQIVLLVTEKGKPSGTIAIVPDSSGKVRLAVYSRHPGDSEANRPIANFRHFYKLLGAAVNDRLIPTWLGSMNATVTPGEACPPGFYIVP